jgi:hypothetical protein
MTLERAAAEFYLRRASAFVPRVHQVTAPLFFQDHTGADHEGSAILLEVGPRRFLITAAHVVDQAHLGELYVRAGDNLHRVTGSRTRTKFPPSGLRDDDQIDIGLLALDDSSAAALSPHEFVRTVDIAPLSAIHHDDFHLIAGYPSTKQILRLRANQIDSLLYPLVAVSREEPEYIEAGMNPLHSLLLGFHKRDTWRLDVGQVTAPDQFGMSGCGVWWLPGYTALSPDAPLLDAICIEWHRHKHHRLLATRMHVVVTGLCQVYPETREALAPLLVA